MVLVLFYAEELKRDVLDRIQATERLARRLKGGALAYERVPQGTKNPVDKALDALVADGAITAADKKEIVGLIDYRNVISHQLQNLLLDVSPERVARELIAYSGSKLPSYDDRAVERLQHFHGIMNTLYRTHHYVTTVSFDGLMFTAAERVYLEDIRKLRRRIVKLAKLRRKQISELNKELSLEGSGLDGELNPRHPLNRYEGGRLTKRGVEICYRLFDLGKSNMAVAHLTGLSVISARQRRRMWFAEGGRKRVNVDILTLPSRRFFRKRDD